MAWYLLVWIHRGNINIFHQYQSGSKQESELCAQRRLQPAWRSHSLIRFCTLRSMKSYDLFICTAKTNQNGWKAWTSLDLNAVRSEYSLWAQWGSKEQGRHWSDPFCCLFHALTLTKMSNQLWRKVCLVTGLFVIHINTLFRQSMGESFQDYSWIQNFHRKSSSKCWIKEFILASLIYFQSV